jgi:hypothetical protein
VNALLEQSGVDETKECPQEIVQLDDVVEQQNDQQHANDELIVELLHGAHLLGRICGNKPTAVDPVSFETWERWQGRRKELVAAAIPPSLYYNFLPALKIRTSRKEHTHTQTLIYHNLMRLKCKYVVIFMFLQ